MNKWPDDLPCPGCGKLIRWGEMTFYQPRTGSSGESWYEHCEEDGWTKCKGITCGTCGENSRKDEIKNCIECGEEGCDDCMEYEYKQGQFKGIHSDCIRRE